MQTYTLPIDLSNVNVNNINKDNTMIDMSKFDFPCSIDNKKHASFIFLRNSGISVNFDFSNCTYSDKSEFLLNYLLEEIEVDIPILATTWIEILSIFKFGGDIYIPSIFNKEEIENFIADNNDLIKEILQFILSLPLYSLYVSKLNGTAYSMDEFEKTDYDKIKMANFCKLADHNNFILLISNDEGFQKPLFYEKIFNENTTMLDVMMDKLPYLKLLHMMTASPEQQEEFSRQLINFINNKSENI